MRVSVTNYSILRILPIQLDTPSTYRAVYGQPKSARSFNLGAVMEGCGVFVLKEMINGHL